MPELRWTLLIIGGLFIVGLALWEIRRQRQAPRQSGLNAGPPSGDRTMPSMDAGGGPPAGRESVGFADASRVRNEPIITLPELQPMDARGEPRLTARREPAHDPPVIEVDDASFARLQEGAAGATNVEIAHDEDTIAMTTDDEDVGDIDASLRDAVARRAGVVRDSANVSEGLATTAETPSLAASASAEDASAEVAIHNGHDAPPSDSVGFATDTDGQHHGESPPLGAEPKREMHAHSVGATAAGAPIVDWPGEGSRKIVALRLVSQPAARFPGRVVRQALAAEGFVLGKFDIFHKAGPNERAVLSAASLTKPGTFALNTIDGQRFGGISLFAVLPGPLPAPETFDELLHTARALNDRLQGALQDERGEPLTPMRSASIRQSLCEGNGSTGHGASAEPGPAARPQPETRQ